MTPIKRHPDYTKAEKKIRASKLGRDYTGIKVKTSEFYTNELEYTNRKISVKVKQPDNKIGISAVDGMEGHEFEHFCADLLRKVGFLDVKVTPGSGDQGVDILATKDDIKYAVQCKNYISTLGNKPVQEVSAGKQFYGCHVGVVMTNSTFTPGAIQLAVATNVLLWDRNKLEELIFKAGGLESFGLYTDNSGCDANCEEEPKNVADISYDDNVCTTAVGVKQPRKGFEITSKICDHF